MDNRENLKKIYIKTYSSFLIVFFIMLVVSFFYSYFSYKQEVYHIQFFSKYIWSSTCLWFLDNLFFTMLTAVVLCFSLVVNRGDVITKDGKKLLFYQIVSRGVYILVFFTAFNMFAMEYITPSLENKLELLRNSTFRATTALNNGNKFYNEENYVECVRYYQEYLSIIEDNKIEDRLREVKNKINLPRMINATTLNKFILQIANKSDQEFIDSIYEPDINGGRSIKNHISDEERKRAWSILCEINFFNGSYSVDSLKKYAYYDMSISDLVTEYGELADIYFARRDYVTAWFYYLYVIESHSSRSNEARNQIEIIKQTLKVENNIKDEAQFKQFVMEKEGEIHSLYEMKKSAEEYMSSDQFQKAYFKYSEALSINNNMRDVALGKDNAFKELTENAVEYSEIIKALKYSGKKNFAFQLSDNQLMSVGNIIKLYNMETFTTTYYLVDANIYNYDKNFVVTDVIHAEYGQMKSPTMMTLYCYNISDKNDEYYPVKTIFSKDGQVVETKTLYKDFIFYIPIDIDILYNFSYDYHKALNFSLIKLFLLKNIDAIRSIPKELSKYVYESTYHDKLDLDSDKALFNKVYYFDESVSLYKIKEDSKSSDIDKLMSLLINKQILPKDVSLGFNKSFIKCAIVEKISRIFLFFIIGMIFITISWRLKATYIGGMPLIEIPFIVLLPIFTYLALKFFLVFLTSFLSVITSVMDNFTVIFVLVIVANVTLAIISTLLLAMNNAE